jgi:hypothetical protein
MGLPLSERMLQVLDTVERSCTHQIADDVSTSLVAAYVASYASGGIKTTLRTLTALERRGYVERLPASRFSNHDHWKLTDSGRALLAALYNGAAKIRQLEAQELNLSVRGRLSPLAERTAA